MTELAIINISMSSIYVHKFRYNLLSSAFTNPLSFIDKQSNHLSFPNKFINREESFRVTQTLNSDPLASTSPYIFHICVSHCPLTLQSSPKIHRRREITRNHSQFDLERPGTVPRMKERKKKEGRGHEEHENDYKSGPAGGGAQIRPHVSARISSVDRSGGPCEPFERFPIGSIGPPSCLFLTMFLT